MIPQRNLSLLANRLHKEHGGRVSLNRVGTGLLFGMVSGGVESSQLGKLLIFKGGTALKRCYFVITDSRKIWTSPLLGPRISMKSVLAWRRSTSTSPKHQDSFRL